jgi:hypothetical protein
VLHVRLLVHVLHVRLLVHVLHDQSLTAPGMAGGCPPLRMGAAILSA